MPTTTDYLNQLISDKADLAANLTTKGVPSSSSETFTELVPKVLDIPSGGSEEWVKPQDWPDISTIEVSATRPVVLLVEDTEPQVCFTLNFSATYPTGIIYWDYDPTAAQQTGDSTTISGSAATQTFEHTYSTNNGTKHIIVIENTSTRTLRRLYINRPTTMTQPLYQTWLWVRLYGNDLNSLANLLYQYQSNGDRIASTTHTVQCLEFVGTLGNVTAAAYMCKYVSDLQKVIWPTSMPKLTTFTRAFDRCISLKSLNIPAAPLLTTFANFAYGCLNLQNVTFSGTSYPALTTLDYMFYMCNLKSITLPQMDNVKTFTYMFGYNQILEEVIPYDNHWLDNATAINGMFYYCDKLKSYDFSQYSCPKVTTIANFYHMGFIPHKIKFPQGLQKITNSTLGLFIVSSDGLLEEYHLPTTAWADTQTSIASFNPSGLLMLKVLHIDCGMNLQRLVLDGTTVGGYLEDITIPHTNATYGGTAPQISLKYQNLNRTALVALFNQLPTLSNKTIDITGCAGAGDLTAADLAIATGKGWTVTK